MVNFEYLELLFTWKVEAEQELEKLQKRSNDPLPANDADWLIRIRNIEIENAKALVNRYRTAIKSYLSHHNQ